MKTLFKLTSILYLFFVISCSKDKSVNNPGLDPALNGNWKLIETFADPGNGSGKWRPVDSNAPIENILFKKDGKLRWSRYKEFIFYTKSDSRILSFAKIDASVWKYFYKVKNDTLILNPPCIEGCGFKYVKIK
ncbi:hypothetical protein AQ505_08625 [Pedobacter sp. PACM 27299]|uniref:hypothetical protein n=1 Tax=Pedobacter sp. PACM 27299 TaxID=1727164 RepID=UPI0007068809|nr:hypothetical protein [Pedobacter sp. PACM 27299]ALL05547.1 hypothetical protein AQ505_08625 [Pedobacter sp. PACM 27299]